MLRESLVTMENKQTQIFFEVKQVHYLLPLYVYIVTHAYMSVPIIGIHIYHIILLYILSIKLYVTNNKTLWKQVAAQ